ncbi:MAG TPA: tetratricopeptide repeat protein [Rhodospirillales bacterium]|nr:tetratricopeptide repeat protein [Rhodospirillales bacterium]
MAGLDLFLKYIRLPVSVGLLGCLLVAIMVPLRGAGARELSFIRDAEIENTIRAYATPVFVAAGLEPSAINIYLVNDNTLNAFVAGGQKLFLNTGLLTRTENAGQVIGVIAHEAGHIAGGHLSRQRDAMKAASAQSILALVLGGAAIIGGQGEVGSALVLGGSELSKRSFLQYSRTQEGAADAAAMKYMEATGQSSRGLREFFEILGDQEFIGESRQDPYYRSHPLTRQRIQAVDNFIANSAYSDTPVKADFAMRHGRMKAKLLAFLNAPTATLRRYRNNDTSIEARYARAIAYYRKADLERALPLIDGLIAEQPDDPYFHELKGQMLYENGRNAEARPSYRKAAELAPKSPLIHSELAQVLVEANDPALLDEAIRHLITSIRMDRSDGASWRQLAIAYGRQGKTADSSLALGEEALLYGNVSNAIYHAERVEKLLPTGSRGWLQAQDILTAARNMKSK